MCVYVRWGFGMIGGLFNPGPSKPPLRGGLAVAHSQLVENVFKDWRCYKDEVEDIKFASPPARAGTDGDEPFGRGIVIQNLGCQKGRISTQE